MEHEGCKPCLFELREAMESIFTLHAQDEAKRLILEALDGLLAEKGAEKSGR